MLQDQNPSGIVNPGPHSQHWPQRRLNALIVSLEHLWRLRCQHGGSLGLPAGDVHVQAFQLVVTVTAHMSDFPISLVPAIPGQRWGEKDELSEFLWCLHFW